MSWSYTSTDDDWSRDDRPRDERRHAAPPAAPPAAPAHAPTASAASTKRWWIRPRRPSARRPSARRPSARRPSARRPSDDHPRDDHPRDDRPRDDRRAPACRPPRSAARSTRACAHRKRREHEEVLNQAATKTDDELSRNARPLVRTNPSGAAHDGSWFVVRSQPPEIVSVSAAGSAHGTHVRTRAGRAHLNEARMRTSRREPVALAA